MQTPEVPGYRIERLIAEGGMARIYLATQESLGRPVALKLLTNTGQADFSDRFLIEGRLIASLRHPNIITIHDIGVLPNGLHYIAMEYVGGGDLTQRLGKPMDPDTALDILEPVIESLAAVHEAGIIHRDIKPANILFRKNGTPVLTDFGVAKQLDRDTRLTQDGHTLGSPSYSSPEQAQCRPVDGRTDLYSIGVTLAEMLLGHNPFHGDTYLETTLNHVEGELPKLPPSLSRYQELLDRVLAKDPDDRFADARELLQYIRDLRAGRLRPVARARRRRQRRKTLTVLGVIVVAVGLAVVVWPRVRAPAPPVADTTPATVSSATPAAPPATRRDDTPREEDGLSLDTLLQRGAERLIENKLTLPEGDSALDYFNRALALDPGNAAARRGIDKIAEDYRERASGAILAGDYKAALVYIKRGESIAPDKPEWQALRNTARSGQHVLLGNQRVTQMKLTVPENDSALHHYQEALKLDPDNDAAKQGFVRIGDKYAGMARYQMDKEHYDKAQEYIDRGLSVAPGHADLQAVQADLKKQRSFWGRLRNTLN